MKFNKTLVLAALAVSTGLLLGNPADAGAATRKHCHTKGRTQKMFQLASLDSSSCDLEAAKKKKARKVVVTPKPANPLEAARRKAKKVKPVKLSAKRRKNRARV